ncbi:MAG: M16 family metallopeptidase, partial [Gammaproteobacteria bacterium]
MRFKQMHSRLIAGLIFVGLAAPVAASPQIQTWQSTGGAQVLFVPVMDLPMVDVRVVFDAGASRDGVHAGLAQLTNELLNAGAGERDEETLAGDLDALGVQLSTSSLRDMALLSMRSLREDRILNAALDMAADMLARPQFPEVAFQRELEQMRIAIEARQQDPGDIADEAFWRAMYAGHAYAEPPGGTTESVNKLTLDAVRAFHQTYYVQRNARVAIVGQLTRLDAEEVVERVLRGLPSGEPLEPVVAAAMPSSAKTEVIDYPSEQTHLLVGQPGMSRTDPDYYALYVGNHILGGSGLVSRVSDEIREQRGLAYSAYSYFMPMRVNGPFQMGLQTRNDQADQALEVLHATLQRFIQEGPTADELQRAKDNIIGGFALRLDSNSKITENLAVIGFYGLPLDYLDRFIERVEAVTLEQ